MKSNYNSLTSRQRKVLREKYVLAQGGKCYHCQEVLSGPPRKDVREKSVNESLFPVGFFWLPIHLHHNHVDGMTIGAVHNYCNAVLWQYHWE